MRRTAAVILLLTLVFSASVTSFAQKSLPMRQPPADRNFVGIQDIRSFSDGQGALIRWQTTFETRNLGFYIFRQTSRGEEQVNRDLIAGYAARSSSPTGYGEKYEFYDLNGTPDTVYTIRSMSVTGGRYTTAPFQPKVTNDWERDTGFPKSYYENHALNRNGELQSGSLRLPKDLQNTVSASLLPPDPEMQHWVAAQPGAKIAVKVDGMYRVTRTELQNAGFNVNTNSANWRLFMEGNEQAIIVGAGDQYIEFYGRGIDTSESDTRMYYLLVDPSAVGKRMQTRVLHNFGGTVVAPNYRATATRQERTQYNSTVKNGEDNSYFGTFISSDPVSVPNPNDPNYQPFILDNIDLSAPTAKVTLRLQGFFNGTHNVQASINDHVMGFVQGMDLDSYSATFTIPTSYLVEGENFFQFTAGNNDFSFFDTATVEFPRRYSSAQNALSFYTSNTRKANVTGFNTADVRVFDVTFDTNTQLLVNFPVVQEGGTFTVKVPSDRAAVMYAVTDASLLQSPSVTFNNPSTLSSPNNTADVIIISYSSGDFLTAAEAWANYRRSSAGGSFNVKVVDVADVFDEFNYGVPRALAIGSFLDYADRHWQAPRPRYVLMIGDASYDPRNYEGFGNWNLVPTKMVNLIFQESGSDEALVPDADDDGRADMAIGRIPARSAFDITTALNKTMGFETPAMQDIQTRGALFAFDLPIGYDFEAMSSALRVRLPQGTLLYWAPRGLPPPNQGEPDPQAHARLLAGLNAGPYIVNYAGHGSAGIWASSSFLDKTDVPSLVNGPNQSIYTMLTCLNGYFIRPRPTDDAIAESLLKAPNGGAAATWASSTDTTPDLQLLMGDRFFEQISIGDIKRMGDLVVDAKSYSLPPMSDVAYSWVLLADPALKVRQ